jgi:hypothetical protein
LTTIGSEVPTPVVSATDRDWAPVLDASKYAVSVVLGDGHKLAYKA